MPILPSWRFRRFSMEAAVASPVAEMPSTCLVMVSAMATPMGYRAPEVPAVPMVMRRVSVREASGSEAEASGVLGAGVLLWAWPPPPQAARARTMAIDRNTVKNLFIIFPPNNIILAKTACVGNRKTHPAISPRTGGRCWRRYPSSPHRSGGKKHPRVPPSR